MEGQSNSLAVIEAAPLALFGTTDPLQVIQVAAGVATALAEVVNKRQLYAIVNGKKFPTVEAWTLLGSMLGVFPITEWSRPLLDDKGAVRGYEARVIAQTLAGRTVGAGEAMCVRGESKTWHAGAQEFAIRSMAQTRATSKALRGPLDFVFKLAGFQPTPAEEMDGSRPDTGEIPTDKATPESVAALKQAQDATTVSGTAAPEPASAEVNSGAGVESAPAPAPSRGPRAKRSNVVQAPAAAPKVEDAPAQTPEPVAVPTPAPVSLVDDLDDGKAEYVMHLRNLARETAAQLQALRVRLYNHKNAAEIALGNIAPQALVPAVPNAGADRALNDFIAATYPGKTLADLTEAELDGTETAPGILRTLDALVERVSKALPS